MINRHNYEEFFLMYVDEELTASQREEVELFVKQNPDLLPELETLQQTKLSPQDEIRFNEREMLLKSDDGVSMDNYEEHFLLYVDAELSENKKVAVEKFVLQHPQLQDGFTLLKQTKLEPERIVFADKRSLYRKEERRVVPFGWTRLAMAASFIGVTVLVWWMMPAINDNINVASVQTNKEKVTPTINDTNKQAQRQITKSEPQKNNSVASVERKPVKQNNHAAQKTVNKKAPQNIKNAASVNDDGNIALDKLKTKEQKPTPETPVKNNDSVAFIDGSTKNKEQSNTSVTKVDQTKIKDEVSPGNFNKSLIQNVAYKEINTNDDNDHTLYVGTLELNKNKMRGIMKKVGGLFSGKSKNALANEDGKLQVANLELNAN